MKIRKALNRKMLLIFFLGISSGLPFLLAGGTLKFWLARENVDISTIGYFSWVGMAYSLKLLWAPLLDRFTLFKMGRRRSWILTMQLSVTAVILYMGTLSPQVDLMTMALAAVVLAALSATQDIAIDAYRREICTDEELNMGTTFGMYGHRTAMLLSGGIGVGLVSDAAYGLSWGGLYWLVGFLVMACSIATWFAPEPAVEEAKFPHSLYQAVVQPIQEFFGRGGSWYALLFIFFFKLGDALGGAMLNPFYVQMGYSNQEIAFVAKTIGLCSSIAGLFIGGLILLRLGIYKSLWIFGVLQALSTLGFALITFTGPKVWALGVTVVFEDISAGMGNVAFVAFIAAICNRRFTATQFAALSSVATLGRNFFSGFSGDMVKALEWAPFFAVCSMIAIPGLVLLYRIRGMVVVKSA